MAMELKMIKENFMGVIVVVKGHPFTGKTTVASAIANWLRCHVLFVDEILDGLPILEDGGLIVSSPQSPQESDRLYRLALEIMCKIAVSQLEAVQQKHIVVIDFPFSSQFQISTLLLSMASAKVDKIRLVVIECKVRNKYKWEMRFEEEQQHYDNDHRQRRWYKSSCWDDVEKAVDSYEDIPDAALEPIPKLSFSKMVIDPFNDVRSIDLFDPLLKGELPYFYEAVEHLIAGAEEGGKLLVEYPQWRRSHRISKGKSQEGFCRGHHSLTRYEEEAGLVNYEATCATCQISPITGPAYACEFCPLALHKDCAELSMDKTIRPMVFTKSHQGYWEYDFTKKMKLTCRFCKDEGKSEFSYCCKSCLFENHIRNPSVPTIVHHEGHGEHFLSIRMDPVVAGRKDRYQCAACGIAGAYGSYCCPICDVHYHSECINLPRQVEHQHAGHDHLLILQVSSEELEDYLCDVCSKKRDPECWYYYCEDCDYAAHTYCVSDYSSVLALLSS